MYTKEEAKSLIDGHNRSINRYIRKEIPKVVGAKEGKLNMDQWFRAQELIKKQNFYAKATKILKELRNDGFNVEMDYLSNKLFLLKEEEGLR